MKHHRVLNWIGRNCKFPSTAGVKLYRKPCAPYLLNWQKTLIKDIFYPDGSIRKSGVMLYGCRKVSKSMLYSFILFYMLSNPKAVGFQVPVLTGRSEEQAEGIILRFVQEQVGMADNSDDFKVLKKSVTHKETKNFIYAQHTQAEGLFGGQASAGVFDEVSNMKSTDAIEAITSSNTLAEDKFIGLYASNVPTERQNHVIPMVRAFSKDTDFVVKRFCAKPKADPFDPKTWSCNPFIEHYLRTGERFKNVYDAYAKRAEIAKSSKKSLLDFQRLYLGQAVVGDLDFIPLDRIKFVSPEEAYGRKDLRWCAGIDCSVSFDFTALSFIGWKQSEDLLYATSFLYLPNSDSRAPSQKKIFESWNANGHIRIQDQSVLNFNEVIDDFFTFVEKTKIQPERIVFDPALSAHYWEAFAPFKPEKIKMTGRNIAPGISELERIGYAGNLRFTGPENPAFLWMLENVTLKTTQRNYLTFNKETTVDNIDLADSLVLPLCWMLENRKKDFLIGAYG